MTASAADIAAAGVAVLHGRLGTHVAIDALNVLAARAEAAEAERDEARDQRDFYQRAMIAAEQERAPAEARVAELEQALREFVDECGVVADDPRLGYVEIQVNVGCIERGRAALGGTA